MYVDLERGREGEKEKDRRKEGRKREIGWRGSRGHLQGKFAIDIKTAWRASVASYTETRHRVFTTALRRHKSRPMMGYMCRRHATISCENVSREPMGLLPPIGPP